MRKKKEKKGKRVPAALTEIEKQTALRSFQCLAGRGARRKKEGGFGLTAIFPKEGKKRSWPRLAAEKGEDFAITNFKGPPKEERFAYWVPTAMKMCGEEEEGGEAMPPSFLGKKEAEGGISNAF